MIWKFCSVLYLLLLYTIVPYAQLPGNFNLVPNGSFSFKPPYDIVIDTTFLNNPTCWISAGKDQPMIGSEPYKSIYFDASINDFVVTTDPSIKMNYMFFINSGVRIDPITNQVVDSSNIRCMYGQTPLLEPLQANHTYHFRMTVFVLENSVAQVQAGHTSLFNQLRNIGVHFSDTLLRYFQASSIHLTPQINFIIQPIREDTSDYIVLEGSFVAAGGEKYLTIGIFDYAANHILSTNHLYCQYPYPPLFAFCPYSFTHIYDVVLVSDTTQPQIGLGYFSLGADTVLCQNDSLVLGGQPYFFNYLWNTGDTSRFITVSQPGIYWCTVDYGCGTYTDTLLVLSAPAAAAMDMPDTAFCGTQYLAAAPPYYAHYRWSTSDTTPVLTITQPGTYWLEVLDYCGGVHTDTFAVTQVDTIGTPTAIADRVLCNDTAIVLQASPGFPYYAWSTGSHTDTAVIRHPGTYYLTVTNACGIVFEDTITVYQGISSLDLGRDTLLCSAEPALALSVPQALQEVLWSTGDTTHQIIAAFPGLYVVTATSPCGKLIDSIQIDFCTPVIETVSLSQAALCEGMCMTYEAAVTQHPASWQWTFEGGTPDSYTGANPPDICYDDPGTYTTRLIVTNAGGSDTLDTHIQVLPIPEGAFRDTVITVPYGSKLLLPSCGEASAIDWYANGILLCAGCPSLEVESRSYESSYVAILQNAAEGCSDSCVYQIRVNDIPDDLWFPTAFSPNGDGLNDDWGAVTNNPNISLDYLKVYNRWGQLVFQGNTLTQKWDGTYRNTPVAAGVYFWMAAYNIKGGAEEKHFRKGDVTVVR